MDNEVKMVDSVGPGGRAFVPVNASEEEPVVVEEPKKRARKKKDSE